MKTHSDYVHRYAIKKTKPTTQDTVSGEFLPMLNIIPENDTK